MSQKWYLHSLLSRPLSYRTNPDMQIPLDDLLSRAANLFHLLHDFRASFLTQLILIICATLLMTSFTSAQAVNYGETTYSSTTYSYGNSNLGIYLKFTSGSAAQYAVNSCSFYAVQQGIGSIECGIY